MTDRIRHLTVVLDRDYRDDDVERIIAAIKQLRHVASVKPHVVEPGDYINRETLKNELLPKLHDAIEDVFRKETVRKMAERNR